MIKNLIIFLLAAALAVVVLMKWPEAREEKGVEHRCELEQILERAGRSVELGSSAIGFCLLDANGAVVVGRNAGQAFIPASTLKTVTSSTALEMLGPEFRFGTELRATAEITGESIEGDLVIRGGGDPSLSVEDLQDWAHRLRAKGVRRITGRVFGDGRFFESGIFDDFWNWGDIGNGYGSPVSGLNLNHNRFAAIFRAGSEVGSEAEFLGPEPAVPGVEWINRVTTGEADSGDGVMIYGGEHAAKIELRGTVPAGVRAFEVLGAAPDPPLYAAHHLTIALQLAGIEISGIPASEAVPEASQILHQHESPPLMEIIRHLHAVSDNHETECLFRLLGKRKERPSDQVIREHWKSRGLNFAIVRMEDGSGLARANFIRPLDLARIQQLAASGPYGPLYRDSLLQLHDGAYRWKGGAMSGVRAYTGLVRNRSGKEYGFALMVNHYEDGEAVSALRDALVAEMREGKLAGE